ncbi:MAG: TonB-dependent receptor [Acidobacteria bacterium]|nr:TonB-dependent receptor [Acidobacteriota bacterium]NIM63346.1 TonB-dependent receptor [Acidobacteriota bacterium]NIO60085.1 TonB-dependent receptor [Acidobacteriota bacterium]NIQ86778.1 TonB-dependent receptor [Acidobacteriota bacterium]NIT12117.1 TonB-dependent receptor [Acidobacteriota bacterium]
MVLLISGANFARAQDPQEPVEKPKTETESQEPSKKEDDKDKEDKEKDKQEPKKPEGLTERVKVTAFHIETELMKTPVAVSVFDQDELDREGVKNVRDMAQMVPNMDIATINGQSTPIISLRGVRSTNETELGDPAVGVHLDGIYSPRMQGILGLMFDNERVEVLRGPQGTLFGRNSTVGSINIITAKPKFDRYEANAVLRVGTWNSREFSSVVNVPVSDKFALRVAGRSLERDSYLNGYWDPNQYDQRRIAHLVQDADVIAPGSLDTNTGETLCTSPRCYTRTQKFNWWNNTANNGAGYAIRELIPANPEEFYMNADEWGARVSALWQPVRNVSVDLLWQRFKTESAGGIDLINCDKLRGRPNYVAVYDEDPNSPTFGDLTGFEQRGTNDCGDMFPADETYQAVVSTPGLFKLGIDYWRSRVTWDINRDLRLVYIGGGEEMGRESAQDMEQSLNAWDQAFYFLPGTGAESWSQEFQLQSYGEKDFNWIAGVNYFRERTSTLGYFDNTIDIKSMFHQPNRATNAGAAFAQGTYSYSPKWHLTLGYRFSDETKEDKGGRTLDCHVRNGCAPQISREQIIPGLTAFERNDLNDPTLVPIGYFADPQNYPGDVPCPPDDPNCDRCDAALGCQENDNKGSWSHHDFRIGLDYDRNEDSLLYAYLATGFKAGGIGDVFNIVNPRTQDETRVQTSYVPEEVTTLELGVKQRLFNRKLDLKANYFYSDYENMQYASVGAIGFTERLDFIRDDFGNPIPDPNGGFLFGWVPAPVVAYFTQNVPGARIQGLEFEYDWRPWPGGRIKGYASWLDTEITDDWITKWSYDPVSYFNLSYESSINPENELLQVNLKGNDLAVSPPFKFHVTVDHAFLLPQGRTTIVPWVTAHWEDDSYLTVWNVDKHTGGGQPCPVQEPNEIPDGCMDFVIFPQDLRFTDDRREAWSMLHAGLRIYRGDWTVEFYGYNLTDEVVQWWGGAAEQVAKGSFSVPRNYGFHVGLKF